MEKKSFSPSICVTHACNLDCVYCYQNHSNEQKMSFETAKEVINDIFDSIPKECDLIKIGFIGGEPLLEFELIKNIFYYTHANIKTNKKFIFFATTNGTILTEEMKLWFKMNKESFMLGLSIDGMKHSHDFNRSNSFDKIDINFFKDTWINQGVKMTISEFSLKYLAENIKYLHSFGFNIKGVNLFEGKHDWNNDEYIRQLITQLNELVTFYFTNDNILLNQMFDKDLSSCELKKEDKPKKWCGIGENARFYNVDGKKYPCSYMSPMTFSETDLEYLKNIDYSDENLFFDDYCLNNCYIFPICSTCAAANYQVNNDFFKRDKSRCRIQKLIVLFIADLQAKKIIHKKIDMNDEKLYFTIEAIRKIKEKYYHEFIDFF